MAKTSISQAESQVNPLQGYCFAAALYYKSFCATPPHLPLEE